MNRQLGTLFLGVLFFSIAGAASQKCQDLIQDLKAMQEAQSQLLHSFTSKNEMMASVLDQNADALQKSISANRKLKRSDLQSMRVSAKAFRGHEKREAAVVRRFEKASNELLGQVQVCLSEPDTLEKLGQR